MKKRLAKQKLISHNRIWQITQNAFNELKKRRFTLTSQPADEESRVRQHALALATMGMGDQQRTVRRASENSTALPEQLEQLKRDSKAKGDIRF